MKPFKNYKLLLLCCLIAGTLLSCSDEDERLISTNGEDDYKYIGQAVEGFDKSEWYPGGELGTTENTTSSCYEDETPSITNGDFLQPFKRGEILFEHYFRESSTTKDFTGLGPAYVRAACIDCHPAYGHGWRVSKYNAAERGNGYLLVIYHPSDGANSDDGPYPLSFLLSTKTASVSNGKTSQQWKADCR